MKLEKISPGLISKLSINEKKRNESQIKNQQKILLTSESDHEKAWCRNDFSIGRPVGKGRFGTCLLAREKRTNKQMICVLKMMSKKMFKKYKKEDNLKAEYEIQKDLRHPNILRMFGFFENEIHVYFILEYAHNGNLYKKILNKSIDNVSAAKYIYQTTKALIYLHSKNIIHRDLKPENILLGIFDEIKLCDFGWSKIENPNIPDISLAGTLNYLCPEMLLSKPHTSKVDNWCLGVLCYELCVGTAPFDDENDVKITDRIKNLSYSKENIPNEFARMLIDKLLQLNPNKRIDLSNVLIDDWIVKYADKDQTYEKYFV